MRDSEELLRLIHNAMVGAGVDYVAVYRRIETNAETFADPVQRCPHDLQKRFWVAIEEVTGDPEIGLTLCPHLPIFHGKALEFVFLSSATFGEGLETALDYQRLVGDSFNVRIVEDALGVRIVLTGTSQDAPQLRHAEICFVSGFILTMRAVTNGVFEPRTVRLCVEQRSSRVAYESVFGCPVDFGGMENEIWIDPSVLEMPSLHRDEDLFKVHRELAESQLAAVRRQDMVDSIRECLMRVYLNTADGAGDCSLEAVAREIGLPVRRIRTELHEAGTSFRELVRKTRFLVARKLLHKTRDTIEDIASLTGFSEPSAFCRAFREWSGTTPAQYRQRLSRTPQVAVPTAQVLEKMARRG